MLEQSVPTDVGAGTEVDRRAGPTISQRVLMIVLLAYTLASHIAQSHSQS